MALPWILVAAGAVLIAVLAVKLLRSSRHEAVGAAPTCRRCGRRIGAAGCPECPSAGPYGR